MNPFVQLVAVIWFFGAVACYFTGVASPILICGIVTVIAGPGYCMLVETKLEQQSPMEEEKK